MSWKRVSVALLLLAMALIALSGFGCGGSSNGSIPSDEAMLRYFEDHKAQFDALLQAVRSDPRIRYVTPSGTDKPNDVADDSGQPVGGPAAQQALALAKELGVSNVTMSKGYFMLERVSDWPLHEGIFKGYVYSSSSPRPLVQTDTFKAYTHTNAPGPVYRTLGAGWYILCSSPG